MIESNTVKLIQLDCKLREILQEIKQIGLLQSRSLLHKTKLYGGPIQHVESSAHFGFFPPDRRSNFNDEKKAYDCSASTSLGLNFIEPKSERRWEGDMEFRHDCPPAMVGLSPSWLLHELYKDSNRRGPLSVDQILGLAKVEVMISTEILLEMDLFTGRWDIKGPSWLIEDWGDDREG